MNVKQSIDDFNQNIIKNISSHKEIHHAAYELNDEYRIFWDNISDEVKKSIKKVHFYNSVGSVGPKYYAVIFHMATMGVFLILKGIISLFRPSKQDRIRQYVTSRELTEGLSFVNRIFNSDSGHDLEQMYYAGIMNLQDPDTTSDEKIEYLFMMVHVAKEGYEDAQKYIDEIIKDESLRNIVEEIELELSKLERVEPQPFET